MATECYRVGIIGGLKLPINVKVFLTNFQRLLRAHETEFELDLIIREGAIDVLNGYNIFDPGFEPPRRALDMPVSLTKGAISYVRKRNPDVLFQITEFATHGSAAIAAGKLSRTPTITRLAGDDFAEYRHSAGVAGIKVFMMRNLLGQIPLRLSDAIVVLGPHVSGDLANRGRKSNVHEIPQPVDRDQFHPASSERVREIRSNLGINNERVFISVGRLTPRKGMDDVISAARRLNEQGVDFRWLVLGSGPLHDKLESVPNVTPLGKVPHEQIEQYYQAADLFVHPSRIDGLPNVLLEATACGVPSVARNVGECDIIATSTFENRDELPSQLTKDYEKPTLGKRFSDNRLREQYASLIIDAAEAEL